MFHREEYIIRHNTSWVKQLLLLVNLLTVFYLLYGILQWHLPYPGMDFEGVEMNAWRVCKLWCLSICSHPITFTPGTQTHTPLPQEVYQSERTFHIIPPGEGRWSLIFRLFNSILLVFIGLYFFHILINSHKLCLLLLYFDFGLFRPSGLLFFSCLLYIFP